MVVGALPVRSANDKEADVQRLLTLSISLGRHCGRNVAELGRRTGMTCVNARWRNWVHSAFHQEEIPMYKNILVPVVFEDKGDAKIRSAIAVAQQLADEGARITLLHVIEQMPGYVASYLPADFTAQARRAVEDQLDDIAATVPGGVGLTVSGHSGRTILDWAEDNKVDLIVVASHRPGMQDLLLGSTAAQVVRHAKCGVHVLR